MLAVMSGSASISQGVLIYLRYRKPVIKYYCYFLASLFLFLLAFFIMLYSDMAGLPENGAAGDLQWMFQAAGGIFYIAAGPYFYHALMGLEITRIKKAVFFIIDVLVAAAALFFVLIPHFTPLAMSLNIALFSMIAYGLLLILLNIGKIADKKLKTALLVFLFLSLVFFPVLYLDVLVGNFPAFSIFLFLENITLPLYFFLLNILTIVFALKYLNRPPFRAGEFFTDFFRDSFGITRREEEIITLLFDGKQNKEIAELLFISSKTVENHIYHIYAKLRVNSRVQLFQLIRANSV